MVWSYSLVKLGDHLLKVANDQKATILGPFRLAHGVTVMAAKDHPWIMCQLRGKWGLTTENTHPGFTAAGSLPSGAFPCGGWSSKPLISGWLIPSWNPKLSKQKVSNSLIRSTVTWTYCSLPLFWSGRAVPCLTRGNETTPASRKC